MNAEEARNKSLEAAVVKVQIEQAKSLIEKAVKDGDFSIYFIGDVKKGTINWLKENGYKCTFHVYQKMKISWE